MSTSPVVTCNVIATAVDTDVRLVTSPGRPNVLVEGHVATIARVFATISHELREPVTVWTGGALPMTGTVIVPNVGRLGRSQQRQLDAWLTSEPRRGQVISTCSHSLFALVQGGAFPSDLYYRLNVVRITL